VREEADADAVRALAKDLSLPDVLCRILAVRGVLCPADARTYLRPTLPELYDPAGLADADRACIRIERAIEEGEAIVVHGDYDVDGVSSATLLTNRIRALGGRVTPFVPHRMRDGYDFGPGGLAAASAVAAGLIVTTDCGIRAEEAVEQANQAGIDVVITDHHTPGSQLPKAHAIVNPNREDCGYPNKSLSGTGVAFKLAQLLTRRRGGSDDELWPDLDLVGLASVADLVPLDGENRILVRYGLRALERTTRPGLRALARRTGLEAGKPIESGQVGFQLAPPINAAGRMSDAMKGLQLLSSTDAAEADALAQELVALNQERRAEDRRTLDAALESLEARYVSERDFGVVVAGEGWHPGVIGIVASRIVERIHKPVVVVALESGRGRGSARSIPGFDLFAAIDACGHLLERYGGHRQAAGMDVDPLRLPDFADAFNEAARVQMNGQVPHPEMRADLEVCLSELTPDVHQYLRYFGPFGIGNARPVFVARSVSQAHAAKQVGSGHLKLFVEQEDNAFEAVGFGLATRVPPESLGAGPLDIAFQLRENTYRGRTQLQLRLRDVRPAARTGS